MSKPYIPHRIKRVDEIKNILSNFLEKHKGRQIKVDRYEFNEFPRDKNIFCMEKDSEPVSDLKKFIESMYGYTGAKVFFTVFEQLIAHQIRVIQYYRLFKHFSETLDKQYKEMFDKYEEDIKNALSVHDSDKFSDEMIVKCYLVQKYIRCFIRGNDGKKILQDSVNINVSAIDELACVLRRLHSDTSRHHDEYYRYHEELPDKHAVFEHIFDIMAITDKKNELIGDFYKKEIQGRFKHFGGQFENLIEGIFNVFKKQESFKVIEKSKEDLNSQKRTSRGKFIPKRIYEKQIEIAENVEKVIWQPIDDGYEKNIKIFKVVSENMLYKAAEKWIKGEKDEALDMIKQIADIKKYIFDISKLQEQIGRIYNVSMDLVDKTIEETENENKNYEGHESFFIVCESKKNILPKRIVKNAGKDGECIVKKSASYGCHKQPSCIGL